jgi:hypothetical protein
VRDSTGRVVLRLPLPEPRPKGLSKIEAEFDKYADECARLQVEKRGLKAELVRAQEADAEAYAKALASTYDAEPQTKNADAVRARAAVIEAKLPVLTGIADEKGTGLAQAVEDALAAGRKASLEAEHASARAEVEAKAAELAEALDAYSKSRAAVLWAGQFTARDAISQGGRSEYVPFRGDVEVAVPLRINPNGPKANGVPLVETGALVSALGEITREPEPERRAVEGPGALDDALARVV